MTRLWEMLSDIPRGLLFMNKAALEVDGFRWAPVSFLKGPLSGSIRLTGDTMSVSRQEKGVFIQSDGVGSTVGQAA